MESNTHEHILQVALRRFVGDDVGEFAGYYLLVADAIRRIPQIREGSEKPAALYELIKAQ